MIICVDMGNTTTTIGILDGLETRAFWRVTTRERTRDEYAMLLKSLVAGKSEQFEPQTGGVCSVGLRRIYITCCIITKK